MPERKPIRNDLDIRNAKPEDSPYRRRVGKGLWLEVRPTGAKMWRYRYRLPNAEGKPVENLYAMGAYGKRGAKFGEFTLDEAIVERVRLRELVKQGKHPVQVRREDVRAVQSSNANTFKAVALEWLETKRATRSGYYIEQIERGLNDDLFPAIGTRPISSITHADLADIVDARAAKAPTVALLLQQWTGAIFRYAMRKGKAQVDPSYVLRGTVQRPTVKSKAPLLRHDFPAFMEDVATKGGNRQTQIALLLLLHLFVRPGELCGAKWAEFNLDAATWKIPAHRMKGRIEHWVHLSAPALALLRELHTLTGKSPMLLPNARDGKRTKSPKSLNKALERMGYAGRLSAHSFRATASTALNEMGMRHDVIEAALAHKERNKTRASYNHAIHWEARKVLMDKWAETIQQWAAGEPDKTNVIQMRGAA